MDVRSPTHEITRAAGFWAERRRLAQRTPAEILDPGALRRRLGIMEPLDSAPTPRQDAYDIYYCIRNYPDGIEGLAEACKPLLEHQSGAQGYRFIGEKFDALQGYGPTSVRKFVEETAILDGRTPEQWQQDAFGQVDAWLRALGLRQ